MKEYDHVVDNDGGYDHLRCKSPAVSSYCIDRLRPDVHANLPVGHCLALGLGLGTRTLALFDDDRRRLRDAGRVFDLGIEKSRCPQEHYLVHGVVERRARDDHGRPVLQRRRGTRTSLGRRARTVLGCDHPCRIDAANRIGGKPLTTEAIKGFAAGRHAAWRAIGLASLERNSPDSDASYASARGRHESPVQVERGLGDRYAAVCRRIRTEHKRLTS
jgi:hypothetical protein